jgi:hypothetical protein
VPNGQPGNPNRLTPFPNHPEAAVLRHRSVPPGTCPINIPPMSTHRGTNARAMGQLLKPPAPPCGETGKLQALLRKEVIQPHLPVRLPCYDLVPIAGPTFDGSLPTRGLGHRLRVLPTFVT